MRQWSRFVTNHPWFWIVGWPLVALVVWSPAPAIQTLLEDDDTGSLPADSPSRLAAIQLEKEFPESAPASRAVVVFVRDSGLTVRDHQLVDRIGSKLNSLSEEWGWHVNAVATMPLARSLLESDDGCAAIVAVNLPAELLTHSTVRRVREIQGVVKSLSNDTDLRIQITGSGALGELLDRYAKRDINMTTLWALVAVIVILLAIYRSPIAMFLPVLTISISLMLSLGLIGWAASVGLPVTGLVEMLVIVIVVGSGVDYCLFLFSRFREEMTQQVDVRRAVEVALTRSGSAIFASAGTNVAGLSTLALAGNRDLYTAGPTIAFSIAVATLAVLTLTPSLLQLVGRHLFWPLGAQREEQHDGIWSSVGRIVSRRPILATLVTLIVLLPGAIVGTRVEELYDAYEEFPSDSSFVSGARLYQHHFYGSQGVSTQTLVLSADAKFDTAAKLDALRETLEHIADALEKELPLLEMRDFAAPLGRKEQSTNPADSSASPMEKAVTSTLASRYYIGATKSATRVDFSIGLEARTAAAMDLVPETLSILRGAIDESQLAWAIGATDIQIHLIGETPTYYDMRELRSRDFRVVAVAAIALIFAIVFWLVRSALQSAVLVAATILTYFTAYGLTWLIFRAWYGLDGISWQVHFLLFVVILSLGQDYNIFVVTRIREELLHRSPVDAVRTAICKTGRVVSSCGLIMAATFASLSAGSLIVMKEFAVSFALGILIDTFIVRTLMVPAVVLVLLRLRRSPSSAPVQADAAV